MSVISMNIGPLSFKSTCPEQSSPHLRAARAQKTFSYFFVVFRKTDYKNITPLIRCFMAIFDFFV